MSTSTAISVPDVIDGLDAAASHFRNAWSKADAIG